MDGSIYNILHTISSACANQCNLSNGRFKVLPMHNLVHVVLSHAMSIDHENMRR